MDLHNHSMCQHQVHPNHLKNQQHHSKNGNVDSLVDVMHGIEK
jgi:hypothetical protein